MPRPATAITDGAYGKPWVYRNKDIKNWWRNAHHNRPGGTESGSPTAWTAEGKVIWFTELGCPAVARGANQPNVFYDPKSSESFFPYYSSGARDDAMQRAFLEAVLTYWADDDNNPMSGVGAFRMLDIDRIHVWAWDARMGPSFPDDETTWSDGANWETGHWISGRMGAAPGTETVRSILSLYGLGDGSVDPLGMAVDGFLRPNVMSGRALLEAAANVYLFDAAESGGTLAFRPRYGRPAVATLDVADLALADAESAQPYLARRSQETDLANVVKYAFGDPIKDDQPGEAEARHIGGGADRVSQVSPPAVIAKSVVRSIAEILLQEIWTGREAIEFSLPPSRLALDPGDLVGFEPMGATYRIGEIDAAGILNLRASRFETEAAAPVPIPRHSRAPNNQGAVATPLSVFIDGPILADDDVDYAGYVAAHMKPWRSGVAFYRSPSSSGFVLDTLMTAKPILGETTAAFYSGPVWRWDKANELAVKIYHGSLASAEDVAVLNGANALALQNADGEWEILQFANAELTAENRYTLSRLLRGQRGSEHAMRDPVAAGARLVILDAAVLQPGIAASDVGLALNWKIGAADRDLSDSSYDLRAVTLTGKGRRPLSPVHLKGTRDPSTGDWMLTWIRRTRIGGDSWDVVEVPLGEASESYQLEILDGAGGDTLRVFNPITSEQLYAAAEQTADFGAPQISFWARVRQQSATYGLGIAEEALI